MRSHVKDYGEVKLDADGNIRLDLPCVECGYNLRGINPVGNCPECGKPKSISYRPRKHTLRWWLIPAAPLAVSNMLLAALNYYCHHYLAQWYWAGPSKQILWYRTCAELADWLPLCLFLLFLTVFILLLTRRQDLPLLLTLIISIILLLLQPPIT